MLSQPACYTCRPSDAVSSSVNLPPLSARHRTVAAPAPPALSSPDWSRRAAALGVSPRAPRRCRYSNPRKTTAANLALLSVRGGSFEAEAEGLVAYPQSGAVTARLGPPSSAPLSSKPHRHQRRSQRLSMSGMQSQSTVLSWREQSAFTADRERFASAEVQTDSNKPITAQSRTRWLLFEPKL